MTSSTSIVDLQLGYTQEQNEEPMLASHKSLCPEEEKDAWVETVPHKGEPGGGSNRLHFTSGDAKPGQTLLL